MRIKEARELSNAELKKKLKELEMELIKLNAQAATGTNPKNPSQIRDIKKTITQIKTILNERRLEQITNG